MNASARKIPGFWKNEPSVAKNSPVRLWCVTTGPSFGGCGSMTLCQQLNARKSPATTNSVMAQASGILPELVANTTAVSLFNFGSSWMTAIAGWFQFVALNAKCSPVISRKPRSLLPKPRYSMPPGFRAKLTAISLPAAGGCDNAK